MADKQHNVKIGIDSTGARKGANEVKNALNEVRDSARKTVDGFKGGFGGLEDILTPGRLGFAALAGAALFSAKAFADFADETKASSQAVGLAIDEYLGLKHAFEVNNASAEDLQNSMFFLSKNITEAVSGAGDGAQIFDALKISVLGANDAVKSQNELFLEVRAKFAGMADGANKNTLAQQVFGRGAKETIKVLSDQESSFQALIAEGKAMRQVTEEDAAAGQEFGRQMLRLRANSLALSDQLGRELVPALTAVMEALNNMGAGGGIGAAVGFVLKGLSSEFTLFGSIATKAAAGANLVWETLSHPLDFAANKQALQDFRTQLALIEEDTERTMRTIFDEGAEKKKKIAAPEMEKMAAPVLPNTALIKANLDNEIKAIDEATKREIELRKAGSDILVEMQNTNVALRISKESEAITAIQEIQRQETAAVIAALDKQKASLQDQLAKNKTVYAAGTKERLAFENDMADKIQAVNDQKSKALLEGQKNELVSARQINAAKEQQEQNTGQALVAMWTDYYKTTEAMRQRDLDDDVRLAQAKADAARANLGSRAEMALADSAVLEAQHKKDLAQENLTATQKEAINIAFNAKKEQMDRRARGGFVEGWREALHTYVEDQNVFFNIGQDMVREAAQGMNRNFQTFFFDAFNNQITSAEDVLAGFMNFAKQISSQVLSQIATQAVMSGISGANSGGGFMSSLLGMFGSTGGGGPVMPGAPGFIGPMPAARGGYFPIRSYAPGGISRSPEVVVRGEGATSEAIVPLPDGRTIPVTMKNQSTEQASMQTIALTILNEIHTPSDAGGGMSRADVINIIDANMRNGGTVHKTIKRGAR